MSAAVRRITMEENVMRKHLCRFLCLCLSISLLTLLTACGGYSQKLMGVWERDGDVLGNDVTFASLGSEDSFDTDGFLDMMCAATSVRFGEEEAAVMCLRNLDGTERDMDFRYAASDDTLTIDPHESKWSCGLGYVLKDWGKTLVIDMGPKGSVTFSKVD